MSTSSQNPEAVPCGRTLPHLPHDENSDSHYPCPGVPLAPAPLSPDLSDASRCVSVHWSLPVQCVLPRTHRENWHEAWHLETGNRMRYRHTIGATEELHHGEWHDLKIPAPNAATPLTPERLAEIRSTLLGEWLAGGWRVRSAPSDGGRDQYEVYAPSSAVPIATFPHWAESVAVFLADANEAVPELLAENARLTAELNRYHSAWHNARDRAASAQADADLAEAEVERLTKRIAELEAAPSRAEVLREGADAIDYLLATMLAPPVDRYASGLMGAAGELRRMAKSGESA